MKDTSFTKASIKTENGSRKNYKGKMILAVFNEDIKDWEIYASNSVNEDAVLDFAYQTVDKIENDRMEREDKAKVIE